MERLEDRLLLTVPVFNPDTYSFSVDENATVGTVVGQVQATDPEGQDLFYSLGEASFGSPFFVEEATGEIKLRRELNYEWQDFESLSIEVTDTDWNSAFATVDITINDIAEHPVFDEPSYAFSIAENAASGIIGSVSATDPQNDPLTYSLWQDDEGYGPAGVKFEIDSATGEISFQGLLDYESGSIINLKAYAFDDGVNVTEVSVQVVLTDVPDDPEFVMGTYAFSIDENEPPTAQGSVGATDPWGLDITYSLDDGFDGEAFSIAFDTGEIATKLPFN